MPTLNVPPSAPPSPAAADPLAGLKDIHLPEDISGLPLAPGWWLLAALLIIASVAAAIGYRRWRRKNRYRREGAALLAELVTPDAQHRSDAEQLQDINQLLKRVALVAYPHLPVAGYHGRDWLQFLQQAAPAVAQPPALADILTAGLYSPTSRPDEVAVFHQYAQAWIGQHLAERSLTLQAEANHAAL